jgi:hypothetical protein
MRARSWLVVVSAVAVTAAVFLGRPVPSQGAGGGVGSGQDKVAFAFSSTAAASVQSQALEGVSAELVSLGRTNSGIGDAFCRLAVMFNDAQGVVLYAQGVDLGPGEIARVDLPRDVTLGEALFRVTFQVLDTDRRGRVIPCSAIPSVRVYDRAQGRTAYYLPIATMDPS